MRLAIAHDYLLQYGGAERVVASWAAQDASSDIHTLAYDPDRTFPGFRGRRVIASISGGFLQKRVEQLLPALPYIASRHAVSGADVALVSTSGWAHLFDYEMPTLAYVHSPARWLYARTDYSARLNFIRRAGLAVSSPHLRRHDQRGFAAMTRVVANSEVSRRRIRGAYGVDVEVVHPPVSALSGDAGDYPLPFDDGFAVVIARARGYKNIGLAVDACRLAGLPCVVVGEGSEQWTSHVSIGVGRVSDAELKSIYARAAVVVGSAHEDFGLTILEANLEGAAAAAIPRGGYLETVRNGVNGVLASSERVEDLAAAIRASQGIERSDCRAWAARFSPEIHFTTLMEIAGELA